MADWLATSIPHLCSALHQGDLPLPDYLGLLERRMRDREPQVLAFLDEPSRFERLGSQAEALVRRYPDRERRPTLFGLAVGVKDIFRVDGFPTHAGSRLPPEVLAGPQADCATQLEEAGALVLGKTVTTEFAYFAPGPTRNPHHPEHTPGGSSSGSAAAVAAGLAPLALGTQTIGSVIRPAAFCGVVGFKPSFGRVSKEGVIPLAPSLDHVGWFTADVAGADAVAQVLCQGWEPDLSSGKPRLAIPEGPYLDPVSPEGRQAFHAAIEILRRGGYDVRRLAVMPDFEDVVRRHQTILAAEAARVHARWFQDYADRYHPRTAELVRAGQPVDDAVYASALAAQADFRQALIQVMDKEGLDLWACPAAVGPAPRGLNSTGDPIMNLPWTQAGFPALTVPCGFDEQGLPFGLQLVGRPEADEALLTWAAPIEGLLRQTAAAARAETVSRR
jgi:Asp-tRNA(Asn)/Glu-tRNA(Gln) amidotransferase A subunit family amidase